MGWRERAREMATEEVACPVCHQPPEFECLGVGIHAERLWSFEPSLEQLKELADLGAPAPEEM